MSRSVARLARMDAGEASWRTRALARIAADRLSFAIRRPHWRRTELRHILGHDTELTSARRLLHERRWLDAHRALQRHFANHGSRFVIRPIDRHAIAGRILREFPDAAHHAAARADRIVTGRYDLLGYSDLRFSDLPAPPAAAATSARPSLPDWHFDPVNNSVAPMSFWSSVPFLDPKCGDHKVIWELNRHQHWLALGRAFWLTGEKTYRQRAVDELASWIDANPPLAGINWASMLELALRSISWVWALHFFADATVEDDEYPWTVDLLLALDRQLTHVEQNLSYYFSPNTHLLGEALALYVAGRAVPELAASARRAAIGRQILVSEISRQIEGDGVHCEQSTHYHRYTLDFYVLALAVARVTRDPIAAVFERAVRRLGTAARVLADDFGRAPHIGDDDGGALFPITGRAVDDWRDSLAIAGVLTRSDDFRVDGRLPEEAMWVLAHPVLAAFLEPRRRRRDQSRACVRSTSLSESGYFVSRSQAGEHVVIDGGPHGYMNGGHAHADALALTFSLRGLPLLIDTGTACYTTDALLRDRFRSTAAHNTVVVDGRQQSLPRGPFHWTHTVDATPHRWRTTDAFDYFDGSHAGYAPAIHRRRALMAHGSLLLVADYIGFASGSDSRAAAAHWHLAPGWKAVRDGRSVHLEAKHERVGLVVPHGDIEIFTGDHETGLGWCSPVYGRVEPCTTVRVSCSSAAPFWILSVFDLNPLHPIESVDVVPVWAEAGAIAHSTAARIVRRGSTEYALFAEPARADLRCTWRVGEFETDARMLFGRVGAKGELTELALVDGSFVRGGSRRAFALTLGHVIPALHIDETRIGNYTPCVASPVS